MSDTPVVDSAAVSLADAHTLVDRLLAADLGSGADDELLDGYRSLERLRRRLAAVEHAFVAEVQARRLPGEYGCPSVPVFLRGLLKLDPGEAKARADAAAAAGPRRAVTGEPLEPVFSVVAAAQAAGDISARHAAVIVRTVDGLPDAAAAEHGERVEHDLVAHARLFDPRQLAMLARRVHDCLDPDGSLHDVEYRERTRGLTVRQRPDGSAQLEGELTAECAERLLVTLDGLAAPAPESAHGIKDPRTPAQRRHDALLQGLELVQRAGLLPSVNGVSATVIVTVDDHTYRTRTGLAETSHGALVPAADALEWGGGDQRVLGVVLDRAKAVTAYSSTHRIFTEGQRLALLARDRGCTFPNCPAPAAWTQIHHITEFAAGGATSLDNAAMLCRYHHAHHQAQGWTCVIHDGRPAWVPPTWVDPSQTPQRNPLHETEPAA